MAAGCAWFSIWRVRRSSAAREPCRPNPANHPEWSSSWIAPGAIALRTPPKHALQSSEDLGVGPVAPQSDPVGTLIQPSGLQFLAPPAAAAEPKPVAAALPSERPQRATPILPVAEIANPLPALVSGSKQPPSIASIISPKRTIVIDAGHGGIDPGAESVAGYHEKEITLATARLLRRALEQTGRYKVVLTRDSDVYLKLHERVARGAGGAWKSIHFAACRFDGVGPDTARCVDLYPFGNRFGC